MHAGIHQYLQGMIGKGEPWHKASNVTLWLLKLKLKNMALTHYENKKLVKNDQTDLWNSSR